MSKERWKIETLLHYQKIPVHIYESRCDTLIEVEAWALTHCKNLLSSRYIYIEHHRDLVYGVYADDRLIGHLKITSIPEKPKCQTHPKH